jgi:hypothetical protein
MNNLKGRELVTLKKQCLSPREALLDHKGEVFDIREA